MRRPTTGSVNPFIKPITGARNPGLKRASNAARWPSVFAAYQFDNHYNSSWADNSTGTWRIFKEGESNDEGLGTNPAGGVDLMTPIPMEVMWPKRAECVNVITPWSCSMTSLAFSSARMEPSLMGLGQFTAFPMAQRKASGNVMALQDTVYATARAAALASPTLAGEVAPVLPQVN